MGRTGLMQLRGTWYVVPTPFLPDGVLDLGGLRRLIDLAIGWGVDGLTVMGVMSEAGALTPRERSEALGAIFDSNAGRVPIAVGCSAASAHAAVDLAREARQLGAAAAMVSAPPLLRNVDQLPAFYERVARDGGLPIVVQDEPVATGVTVPVSVLLRCLAASGSTTVKLEDPPTPPKIARLLAEDSSLAIFGGLGGVSALGELRRGASGTMTGFAFPEILRAVRIEGSRGDWTMAGRVFDRYLPLIQFEAQPVVGLGIRKEVLRRRGAIPHATTRGLSPDLDPLTHLELDEVLERVSITPSPERFEIQLPA
jgi:4-hydroxy-tetrahydrodipicolinate synthase